MELTGTIDTLNINYITGQALLNLNITEKERLKLGYDELKDTKLNINIKKFFQKRSLDANNYCWHLINEIANVLRASKEDIYLRMLKHYGQSIVISALQDVKMLDFVKYYEEFGESELNGNKFKHYKVYKGSSEFDSREMSILIDGVVSEAKELEIETKTPEELEKMKGLWNSEKS